MERVLSRIQGNPCLLVLAPHVLPQTFQRDFTTMMQQTLQHLRCEEAELFFPFLNPGLFSCTAQKRGREETVAWMDQTLSVVSSVPLAEGTIPATLRVIENAWQQGKALQVSLPVRKTVVIVFADTEIPARLRVTVWRDETNEHILIAMRKIIPRAVTPEMMQRVISPELMDYLVEVLTPTPSGLIVCGTSGTGKTTFLNYLLSKIISDTHPKLKVPCVEVFASGLWGIYGDIDITSVLPEWVFLDSTLYTPDSGLLEALATGNLNAGIIIGELSENIMQALSQIPVLTQRCFATAQGTPHTILETIRQATRMPVEALLHFWRVFVEMGQAVYPRRLWEQSCSPDQRKQDIEIVEMPGREEKTSERESVVFRYVRAIHVARKSELVLVAKRRTTPDGLPAIEPVYEFTK